MDLINFPCDFVLFGHSLGISDSSYFSNYFEKLANSELEPGNHYLKFYFYGANTGYLELMKALDLYTNKNINGLRHNNETVFIDSSLISE